MLEEIGVTQFPTITPTTMAGTPRNLPQITSQRPDFREAVQTSGALDTVLNTAWLSALLLL